MVYLQFFQSCLVPFLIEHGLFYLEGQPYVEGAQDEEVYDVQEPPVEPQPQQEFPSERGREAVPDELPYFTHVRFHIFSAILSFALRARVFDAISFSCGTEGLRFTALNGADMFP